MTKVGPGSSQQALVDSTAFLANKVGGLLLKDAERRLAQLSLNTRSYFVLAALDSELPPSQKDLSQLLGVDPTLVVALIDDMQSAELVERSRNPQDRRRYELRLTPKGVRTLADANQVMAEIENEFFAPLNERQLGQFRTILKALIKDRWPVRTV